MNIINVLSKTKREVVYKIITSLFIQGLALIIPIFWSDTINYITEDKLNKAKKEAFAMAQPTAHTVTVTPVAQ